MTLYTDTLSILFDETEQKIREIGAEAFRTGDDLAAGNARDAVSTLKELRLKLSRPVCTEPVQNSIGAETEGGVSRSSYPVRRTPKKGKYPRYELRSGNLVRIGWSKKNKEEYEHKVSIEAYHLTVKAMEALSKIGPGPYMAEKIIEVVNESTSTVPIYQVYVVIGFLKENGCLKQEGREGYSIPEDIATKASSAMQDRR